ncbi:V-type ATP synthase subunit K [Lentisphaerota bacterium ZTH]|nr:V-type ATP synthase subunit K [Lentisphaerota bacterium]WET06139.1 V-type ATP synthase subunit K [Lentisphaerota bacterium ZTH]
MDTSIVFKALGEAGGYAAVGLAAIGSAIGTGVAGSSAIGAWKKCYAHNKPAPFLLLAYAGAPLSQTIYGLIMLIFIKGKLAETPERWPLYLVVGIFGGIAMGVSAWYQGKAGAGGCDSFAETGKGFANNLMVLGIVETVAIFALVFSLLIL